MTDEVYLVTVHKTWLEQMRGHAEFACVDGNRYVIAGIRPIPDRVGVYEFYFYPVAPPNPYGEVRESKWLQ